MKDIQIKQNLKSILIFGHSNIGDVCYDLAVVKPLRESFPQAKISFITSPKAQELASAIAGINDVIVFDKQGRDKGLCGNLRFIRKIRAKKFDLAIILRRSQMYYFFGIKRSIAQKDYKQNYRHVAQKNLKILNAIGIEKENPGFEFRQSYEDKTFVQDVFKQYNVQDKKLKVGIMPLAGWPLKCWPIDRWNELIKFLASKLKAKVFVFGRINAANWEQDFVGKISDQAISLINKCSLRQSMAFLSQLDLFIGLDTSFSHIASCMQIPTISLYGATDPGFIYPFFHKANTVISKSKLKCMPCYPGRKLAECGTKDEPAPCMLAIKEEEVIEMIKKIVKV